MKKPLNSLMIKLATYLIHCYNLDVVEEKQAAFIVWVT